LNLRNPTIQKEEEKEINKLPASMYQQVDEAKQVLEGIQSAESAEQLLSILRKKGAIPENVFDEKNFNPFLLWKDSEPAATQGKSIIKRLTGWKGLVDRSIDLLIDK
jgi:hypothetical protein